MDAIIIAHGDLDGMTAAAITIAYLQHNYNLEKYELLFSQPFNLHETLRKIFQKAADMTFIIDVALDEEHWPHIKKELLELTRKSKIIWIDHHRSTIQHVVELLEMNIPLLASIDGCAVTIVGEAFLEKIRDKEFFSKLVVIGEVSDKVKSIPNTHPLKPIIEVLGNALSENPTDDDFKRKLVRTWLKEKTLVTDEAARRSEEAVERLKALLKEASENIIYDTEKLRIIDLRNIRVHGYAGKIASHHANSYKKITLLLFRVGEVNTIVTARVPENIKIDIASILKNLAEKYGGGGGGHPRAASARVPSTMANEFIRELIKEIESSI